MRRTSLAVILACGFALPNVAGAEDWPTRPITLVVPYAAGGPVDTGARIMAARLSELLGQQVIIENMGGAGGMTGAARVAKAPPDGYTMLLSGSAVLAQIPNLYKHPFYNPLTDFEHAALFSDSARVLITRKDFPAKNFSEFIAYAKANQTKMQYGSAGAGSGMHVCALLLDTAMGTKITHVPYRGSAPGLTDVMSGQIQGMFDNVTSSFELVRAGKLRALGVTTRERSAILPDVPPIADTLPGYETSSFYGVGAPHDTPKAIVDLLNKEINAALADPGIKQRIAELGAMEITGNASEFSAMLAGETERWRKVVELSGVRKE